MSGTGGLGTRFGPTPRPMPVPDVLPPELWHHTVAISSIDRADLVPWLSVAPYTCAKGMHDAAFARIFRILHIGAQREDDWLE